MCADWQPHFVMRSIDIPDAEIKTRFASFLLEKKKNPHREYAEKLDSLLQWRALYHGRRQFSQQEAAVGYTLHSPVLPLFLVLAVKTLALAIGETDEEVDFIFDDDFQYKF